LFVVFGGGLPREIREKTCNSMFQIQPITLISYGKTPLLLLWFDAPYDNGCRDAQDDFPRSKRRLYAT
jgi:hypothetical protein